MTKKDKCDALELAGYLLGGVGLLIGIAKTLCKC
jgi:hypothetical protein